MKKYQSEYINNFALLSLTGLLLVASIHLSLGEVGLQILGVQPITKNMVIDKPREEITVNVALTLYFFE